MKLTNCSNVYDLGKVLFMGRNGCFYSNKIKKLLKENSKKFYYIESKKIKKKFLKNI